MLLWFGAARNATPYPRSTLRGWERRRRKGGAGVSSTPPPAAGAGESRATAAAACPDTDNNNLELSAEEPQVGLDRVVPPRIQTHLIPGRLVARRLHFVQIVFKIRRHSE